MKTFLIILLAVIYLIGIWTVKYLDEVLPESVRASRYHYPVLITMWVFTPFMVIGFLIHLITRYIKRKLNKYD